MLLPLAAAPRRHLHGGGAVFHVGRRPTVCRSLLQPLLWLWLKSHVVSVWPWWRRRRLSRRRLRDGYLTVGGRQSGRRRPRTVGSTTGWRHLWLTVVAARQTRRWRRRRGRFRHCVRMLQGEQLRLYGGQELLGSVGEEVVRVEQR